MPVIPSFGAYAPKPDLAGAYLGAQRNQLQAAQLAQQFQEAQARNQLGYAQIESQRAQNEAQLAATLAAKEQAFAIDQQRLAIDKAYKDANIGLEEAKLAQSEQKSVLDFAKAFSEFEAQAEYRKRFPTMDEAGRKRLAQELLPSMGYSPSSMFDQPREEREPLVVPEVFEQGGQRFYRAEKGGKPIPIPEDQAQIVERSLWQGKVESARDDIKRLKDSISASRQSYPKDYKPSGKLKEMEQSVMDGIAAKEKELEEEEKKLQRLLDSAPIKAPLPYGGAGTPPPTSTGTNVIRFQYVPTEYGTNKLQRVK